MKLNLLPAKTGLRWIKQGIRLFFRQPLAMSGLFFMFMAVLSVASLIPLIGSLLALVMLPAATLGLMAASQQAEQGKFPMPTILITAFRAGRQRARAMLVLGGLYPLCFMAVLGLSALCDGGYFAELYLFGGRIDEELVSDPDFQLAMWVAALLYAPMSMLFWHAPALVHWHEVQPVKSLFFSALACWKNKGAFLVYALGWMALLICAGLLVALSTRALGSPGVAAAVMLPLSLVLAAMFFSSIYGTFRDSFEQLPPTDLHPPDLPRVDEIA
jgi:hypothetical protein